MSTSNDTIPHEAISERAKRLWEAAGKPEGADLEHWLKAEQELRRESGAAQPPAPERNPLRKRNLR